MMLVIHAAFYKHELAFMPLGRFPMHKCERSKCNRAQIILKRGEKSRKLMKSKYLKDMSRVNDRSV